MNLQFELNNYFLFYEALTRSVKLEGWVDVQNQLWEKYKRGYQLLQGNLAKAFLHQNPSNYLKESLVEIEPLLEEGMGHPLFKQLVNETEHYKTWLENEWNTNKEKIISELKDILRINLPSDTVKVLVVNNKMKGGLHLDKGLIMWGHSEDWPNYSLVYLAHEFLHDVFGKSDIEHAVIELTTDNELRLRLNNQGDYFYINGKPVGHPELLDLEKKLYPDWMKYLTSKDCNIYQFIQNNK